MKINGILNSEISKVLSYMGHTDEICICDCGLSIPQNVKRIDLSLELAKPSFMEVLKSITKDMKIEKIILATEIETFNNEILNQVKDLLKDISLEFVSHSEFKQRTQSSKCVIRTGEATPYANIILVSGVIF